MENNHETPTQPIGRPRSETSKNAILNATIHLLEQADYASLTIEGIAANAGVSKATIYRWWNNKTALVLDAFLMVIEPVAQFPETATVREKFLHQLQVLSNVFNSRLGRTMLSIITENEPESEIVKSFQQLYISPRREYAKSILEKSVALGEINSVIDLDIVLDMLYGPVYFRVLISKKTLDREYSETLVDHMMGVIGLT
jgi:AcrR family transcriptional regulator